MKLPSFQFLIQESGATFKRFPFALVNALIGTAAAVWLIDQPHEKYTEYPALIKVMCTAGLGIALFTASVVLVERRKWSASRTLVSQGVGALLLLGYFVSLPLDLTHAPTEHVIRFFLLGAGFHFLVAIAPFAAHGEVNGFWQFNKALFLRFLTGGLYSGVLFIGLAIALASVDKLLGFEIDDKRYGQLWVFLAGGFNTWFFLAGVPKDIGALEHRTDYPRGLKIFTQYVLIPLVIVYLAILYLYSGKIITEWQWPNGWVANLVLGFSVAGILSLLLVYPIREHAENIWMRFFSRWYYIALIPLVLLLTLSIWRRISEYGITENRYFVVVLGIWLAGIIVYMLLSKIQNIKVIPASLCLLAFLTAYGPWSAFAISVGSQRARLDSVLARNNMLLEGRVEKAGAPVPYEDMKEISSIVRYLVQTHGAEVLVPYFDEDVEARTKARFQAMGWKYSGIQPSEFVALMGLRYINERDTEGRASLTYSAKKNAATRISGFDHAVRLHLDRWESDGTKVAHVDGVDFRASLEAKRSSVVIARGSDSAIVDLKPMLEALMSENGSELQNDLPQEKMMATGTSRDLQFLVSVQHINVEKLDSIIEIKSLDMYVFVGPK